ncbi:hypothetical protein MCUN1_003110 [Malassezia cuniculi]|uniref:Glutaredoxin domain-containing protein n=1 Tax=Malassezia cuniculi TaxID=948313 RepID=A0AAF0F0U7_9BASI|nr:hypothetical protein MCUN1_003110 [Malassezia cuniculi]
MDIDIKERRAWVPHALWRRRKLILGAVLACILFFWLAPANLLDRMPVITGGASRAFVDAEIADLVSRIPGASPGVTVSHQPNDAHVPRNGEFYPTKDELRILFLEHARIPNYNLDESIWPSWLPWLEGQAQRPKYAHYDYLTELRNLPNGDIRDVRQFLEKPVFWRVRHGRALGLTVFSKSYCPYSRQAKSLLHGKNAKFTVIEADLRPDYETLHRLIIALYSHRTFPGVIAEVSLIGGYDSLVRLDEDGHLDSILRGVGAFNA